MNICNKQRQHHLGYQLYYSYDVHDKLSFVNHYVFVAAYYKDFFLLVLSCTID